VLGLVLVRKAGVKASGHELERLGLAFFVGHVDGGVERCARGGRGAMGW
jgi:hypothetical protein